MNVPENRKMSRSEAYQAFFFFMIFLSWLALYLIILRPIILQAIMSTFGMDSIRFPATLHLLPIIGLPTFALISFQKIKGKISEDRRPPKESR